MLHKNSLKILSSIKNYVTFGVPEGGKVFEGLLIDPLIVKTLIDDCEITGLIMPASV